MCLIMATLNGEVNLTRFTVHLEENTAFDGTEEGTDDLVIKVTNFVTKVV